MGRSRIGSEAGQSAAGSLWWLVGLSMRDAHRCCVRMYERLKESRRNKHQSEDWGGSTSIGVVPGMRKGLKKNEEE